MPPTHTDEGLQIAARLRKTHPQIGVVLLSQFDAPVYARALLEEGSAGRVYLLKERVSDPEQLIGAIREVARDGAPSIRTVSNARRSWRSTTLANLTRNGRDACPDRYLGCMGRGPRPARQTDTYSAAPATGAGTRSTILRRVGSVFGDV